jgi:hypothetical protein
MVGECPESRGGSCADGTWAAQPLGRGDILTPTVIGRVEVEKVGRLGDHRANSFSFDESRWFETYRTLPALVKQKKRKRAIVLVTVR